MNRDIGIYQVIGNFLEVVLVCSSPKEQMLSSAFVCLPDCNRLLLHFLIQVMNWPILSGQRSRCYMETCYTCLYVYHLIVNLVSMPVY